MLVQTIISVQAKLEVVRRKHKCYFIETHFVKVISSILFYNMCLTE